MTNRRLHRVLGACVAIPLLLLVVTGVALQFTDSLSLNQAGVSAGWVHKVYAIQPPDKALKHNDVYQLDEWLFTATRALTSEGRLLGSAILPRAMLIVTAKEFLLVPYDPDIPIERTLLPARASAFGLRDASELWLATQTGNLVSIDLGATWQTGSSFDAWMAADLVDTPAALGRRYGAELISWERWLQDLHSGRFFGAIGEWIMTLASALMIVLAVTGLSLWMLGRPRR